MVWKRQEYELVLVIILHVLLLYHKNRHWYVKHTKYTARRHGCSAGIEIEVVVVWVVEIDEISMWGIGVDLTSV